MAKKNYPIKESKRRSKAITQIVNVIGKDVWNSLSTGEKNKRIHIIMKEQKKRTKKEREEIKELNRYYKSRYAAWVRYIKRDRCIKYTGLFYSKKIIWLYFISTYTFYVLIYILIYRLWI